MTWALYYREAARGGLHLAMGWELIEAVDADDLAAEVELCAEELTGDEIDVEAIVAREVLPEGVAGPRRRVRFDITIGRTVTVAALEVAHG